MIKIDNVPIKTHFEAITRLFVVQQGSNTIKLTKEEITALKQLNECSISTYIGKYKPINKFTLLKNFNILCKCNETNSVILLVNTDIEYILTESNKYKTKLARDRDYIRK